MEKGLLLIVSLILSFSMISCKKESGKDLSELYSEKSAELVNQILSENINCQCIVEPPPETFLEIIKHDMPEMHIMFRKNTMAQLNMDQQSTLDSMLHLSNEFNLEKLLVNTSIKFIDGEVFESINSMEELEKWNKMLADKCPENLCYITKPIFSEDFKLVLFDLGYPNYSCFPSTRKILKYYNNKWDSSDYTWD